jgi:hypothetical protein
MQDSAGNEEKRYPVSDSNKDKLCHKPHKNILKEDILQVITENFMEMLPDMVKKMYRRHSRNSQTTKIKKVRRHKNK